MLFFKQAQRTLSALVGDKSPWVSSPHALHVLTKPTLARKVIEGKIAAKEVMSGSNWSSRNGLCSLVEGCYFCRQ